MARGDRFVRNEDIAPSQEIPNVVGGACTQFERISVIDQPCSARLTHFKYKQASRADHLTTSFLPATWLLT